MVLAIEEASEPKSYCQSQTLERLWPTHRIDVRVADHVARSRALRVETVDPGPANTVHGLLLEVLANTWEVENDLDAGRLQDPPVTDARELKEGWSLDSTGGDDDLAARINRVALAIARTELDASCRNELLRRVGEDLGCLLA